MIVRMLTRIRYCSRDKLKLRTYGYRENLPSTDLQKHLMAVGYPQCLLRLTAE
jgi:hypothetical protein